MMKKQLVLTAVFALLSVCAFAYGPLDGEQLGAPVDGGLSFLLIAGAAGYGAKKIAEKKKRKAEGLK